MLTTLLVVSNLVVAVALILALREIQRRRERRKLQGLFGPWPIRKVDVDQFDSRFALGDLGPSKDSEIRFVPTYHVPEGIGDFETWVICNLAKDARTIFEFGTGTGKTTYLLALNSPPEARITTLTLPMAEQGHQGRFYYEGSEVAGKIEQQLADSKTFDEAPREAAFDLVFVDGGHTRSYVENDSRKALRMVKPGGFIIWHDYLGRRVKDVFEVLNELSRERSTSYIWRIRPSSPTARHRGSSPR